MMNYIVHTELDVCFNACIMWHYQCFQILSHLAFCTALGGQSTMDVCMGLKSTVLTLFPDRLEIAGPSIPCSAAAGSTVVIISLTPLQVFPDDEVWSDGMGLVFLLHVQADVAIFVLVWLEDQRRKRAGADEESESE